MKWIGQHIYDRISRFRNSVYLEDVSSGTIASGGNLGLDSNNKIVKDDGDGVTDLHSAGVDGSANQLLTDDGDGTVTSEANLTFDGSNLSITSATEAEPVLTLKTTHTTVNKSGELQFLKDAADTEDNERLGLISFYGEDEGNNNTKFAHIQGKIAESDDGAEGGKLEFAIASHDAGMVPGLTLKDGDANDEVDVTIANGAASITTVAGSLTMGSTAAMDNDGLLTVANQTGITGTGTITSGTWNSAGTITTASQPNFTTLGGVTSLGTAGATTNIAAGDLTMYNPVADGNPTISLGSSATNRFEIKTLYNSGSISLDQVQFNSYTSSSTNHDGRYIFNVDEVQLAKIIDSGLYVTGNIQSKDADAILAATDTTTSSATQGGKVRLISDDDAVMGDTHRLGVIQFEGAEDAGSGAGENTHSIGARIQAVARDAWDGSNNDANLEFYTTDGTTESKVLTLDADKLATFKGGLTVQGGTNEFTSARTSLTLKSTHTTASYTSALNFVKDAADVVDGESLADINFVGDNDVGGSLHYAQIQARTEDVRDSDEAGKLSILVACSDGSNTSSTPTQQALIATGHGTNNTVDIGLGFGAASKTTVAGDLAVSGNDVTIYNAVNDGNPTISLGSSATDRLLIRSIYNTGAQTFDEARFTTYTTDSASPTHAGMFSFYVHEVEKLRIQDGGTLSYGNLNANGDDIRIAAVNTEASSATQGGKLSLISDDGAAMGDDHRLGVIEFKGAEDASNNHTIGARIEAMCDAAWSGSENSGRLDFYVTKAAQDSGSMGEGELKVLTLDSDKLATFMGAVTVTGALTGTLATASQTNITGVGTIGTGVWQGTAIASAYLDADTAHLSGTQTFTGAKTFDEDIIGETTVQKWIKNVAYVATQGTTETFIPMAGSAENTSIGNGSVAMIMPTAGKLLKVHLKTQRDHSGVTTTVTMYNLDADEAHAASNFSSLGVQSATGPADTAVGVFDFQSSLDSGTNAFTAGEAIAISITNDGAVSSSCKYLVTLVFELDWASY
jgi:hypothetical protein